MEEFLANKSLDLKAEKISMTFKEFDFVIIPHLQTIAKILIISILAL